MKQVQADFDVSDASLSRFDKVIEWLLILLLVFAPLAFGAVHRWSEEVVLALAAAISICFLLKLVVERQTPFVWSWAYIPVALFILVAIFQLIRLPSGLVSTISPNTVAIKRHLLGDLPNSSALLESMAITFYPSATNHDVRLVFAIAMVFLVVVNVYLRAQQIKRLLAAIAIIGGSIAILALAQDLLGNGKIYWSVEPGVGAAHAGPFVNHSHYGQFMNLCVGAALGLILVRLHEDFSGKRVTPPVIFDHLASPAARVIWLLTAMIVISVATIFVSLTRGGMISMFIAAAFTTLVVSSRQSVKGQGWIMVIIAMGAFICVLYVGFDAVYDRLASLRQLHQAQGSRWQILKDISVAWAKFPVIGTGLGTHEVVYPMFDRSTTAALAAYAENEYAQTAEETGLIGLVALVGFAVLVWASYVRNIRRASMPICSAAYGLGFGLMAVMLHSLSDFGQHLPANALLSAVFCALLLGLARFGKKDNLKAKSTEASVGSTGLRIVILVCASGIWAWVLLSSNNARLAEAHWQKALALEQAIVEKDWQASDEEYIDLISYAAAAADSQPDNAKYRHWLNLYRWKSISRTTDPNTGAIVIPGQVIGYVGRIVNELNNVRLQCPTYGATYCVIGQLERFVLGDPNGADRIRKGFQLAPCDPTACFLAGLLNAEEQQFDASFEKFSRAIALDDSFFRSVAGVYINHVDRPDLAVAISGDNTDRLSYVANVLVSMEEHTDIVENARARVVELLRETCSKPDAPASALASLAFIYEKEENNEAAIECYRQALALDYGQIRWRFALAELLREAGRIPEAIHEARICLRLRPQFKVAERLIAELSVLPPAMTEDDPVR